MCLQFSGGLSEAYLRGIVDVLPFADMCLRPIVEALGKKNSFSCFSCRPTGFFVEFTDRNQTTALTLMNKNRFCCLWQTSGKFLHPSRARLFSRLCFIESIDHSFSLVPSLFLLASLSCLTLLLIIEYIHSHTHTQKQTSKTHWKYTPTQATSC